MKLFHQQRPERRCLVFAPLAYLKLQYLCHAGPTEVGAFAISAPHHLLYITDLLTIRQETTAVSVRFDDNAVADYFDHCVDQGLRPAQFARIWIHTHPGSSALPSGTDEETFRRVFGTTDWAIMAILSREGRSYARLQVNAGPGARGRLRWRVDWASWPDELPGEALPLEVWRQEYEQNVHPQTLPVFSHSRTLQPPDPSLDTYQLQDLDGWYGDPQWASLGDTIYEYPIP